MIIFKKRVYLEGALRLEDGDHIKLCELVALAPAAAAYVLPRQEFPGKIWDLEVAANRFRTASLWDRLRLWVGKKTGTVISVRPGVWVRL